MWRAWPVATLALGLWACTVDGPLLVAVDGGEGGVGSASSGGAGAPQSGGQDAGGVGPGAIRPGMRLQYQLTGDVDTGADAELFVLDLNVDGDALRAMQSAGEVVVAYLSAGTYESFRDDTDAIPEAARGNTLPDYPNEAWWDFRTPAVRQVLTARLDRAAAAGFDGVFPGSLDGYQRDNGLGLSAADQLSFNRWIATQAHARGLLVGLSGDFTRAEAYADDYDFAIANGCLGAALDGAACAALQPFSERDKAVFNLETEGTASAVCPAAAAVGIPTTLKAPNFDAWLVVCP